MRYVLSFFFTIRLLLFNLVQVVFLFFFILFRKKALLFSLVFILIISCSIILTRNQQLHIAFQKALHIQQQELLQSQIQSEIIFWEQLSTQVDSVHIWLRLSELYTVLGDSDMATVALDNAQRLDPLLKK